MQAVQRVAVLPGKHSCPSSLTTDQPSDASPASSFGNVLRLHLETSSELHREALSSGFVLFWGVLRLHVQVSR